MGVASLPGGARDSLLFYQLHKTAPLLTIALCHYEANSQLATHTQPQVQSSLQFIEVCTLTRGRRRNAGQNVTDGVLKISHRPTGVIVILSPDHETA